MLQNEHSKENGGRGAEPPTAATQRVALSQPLDDQVDKRLVVEDGIDLTEDGIPGFVPVGQQHFEDAALRMSATDHGASMETEWLRCLLGEVVIDDITCHHGAAPQDPSRKLNVPTLRRRA